MGVAYYLSSYALLLYSLAACAYHPVGDYQPLPAATVAPTPELLFLSGRLTAEAAGLRLQDVHLQAVPGVLKTAEAVADTPDFLRIAQLNSQNQVVKETRVIHPLRHSVEYAADDQRSFRRSEVKLATAEFFVRLVLQPNAASVRIEEVADGKTTLLSELAIPSKP